MNQLYQNIEVNGKKLSDISNISKKEDFISFGSGSFDRIDEFQQSETFRSEHQKKKFNCLINQQFPHPQRGYDKKNCKSNNVRVSSSSEEAKVPSRQQSIFEDELGNYQSHQQRRSFLENIRKDASYNQQLRKKNSTNQVFFTKKSPISETNKVVQNNTESQFIKFNSSFSRTDSPYLKSPVNLSSVRPLSPENYSDLRSKNPFPPNESESAPPSDICSFIHSLNQNSYNQQSTSRNSSKNMSKIIHRNLNTSRSSFDDKSLVKKKQILGICSENQVQSQYEYQQESFREMDIKYEQSSIFDQDIEKTFLLLPTVYENNQCCLRLAIQKLGNFAISWKEVDKKQVLDINSEISAYNKLQYCPFVLELYQVQLTEQNFLFFKEPFTNKITKKDNLNLLILSIKQTLLYLEKIQLFPQKILMLKDIVICHNAFKLQNMAIFGATKKFTIMHILTCLSDQFKWI